MKLINTYVNTAENIRHPAGQQYNNPMLSHDPQTDNKETGSTGGTEKQKCRPKACRAINCDHTMSTCVANKSLKRNFNTQKSNQENAVGSNILLNHTEIKSLFDPFTQNQSLEKQARKINADGKLTQEYFSLHEQKEITQSTPIKLKIVARLNPGLSPIEDSSDIKSQTGDYPSWQIY